MKMAQVLIIANPVAGKGEAVTHAKNLKSILENSYQAEVTLKTTQQAGDGQTWSQQAAGAFDTVICLGGDGTVRECVVGLMQSAGSRDERPTFAFIPLGTANDLGRALGYSMNPTEAVQSFQDLTIRPLDVAKINDSYFMNVMAIGSIPESVMNTDSSDKNRLGFVAYLKDGLVSFFNQSSYSIGLTVDQQDELTFKTNLVLIGLTNSVGSFEHVFPEATYHDGLLHLVAIRGDTAWDNVRALVEYGLKLDDSEHALMTSVHSIRIRALEGQTIQTNLDGDEGPELPVDIEVQVHALSVWVPR